MARRRAQTVEERLALLKAQLDAALTESRRLRSNAGVTLAGREPREPETEQPTKRAA